MKNVYERCTPITALHYLQTSQETIWDKVVKLSYKLQLQVSHLI
jgi:hypothetical protein